jgi:hypothetical protein
MAAGVNAATDSTATNSTAMSRGKSVRRRGAAQRQGGEEDHRAACDIIAVSSKLHVVRSVYFKLALSRSIGRDRSSCQ